jgi:hypothetical protein
MTMRLALQIAARHDLGGLPPIRALSRLDAGQVVRHAFEPYP